MKIFRFIVLVTIPLLFSCLPKKPEIPGARVPADPFLPGLEQLRAAVTTFKAIGSIEVVKGGRKRSFDTVGIVFDARRRLRLEAFSPLGQSITVLVWDGNEVLVRLQDGEIKKPGPAGIEKILGISIDAKELCALLSGTVSEIARRQEAQAFCETNGACVIELLGNGVERRVHIKTSASSPVRVTEQELYRGEILIYRVRYDWSEPISNGLIPATVVIENPGKQIMLTLKYSEADLNVPVPEDVFTLMGAATGAGNG